MSRFKKSYCRLSVAFAVIAILISVIVCTGQSVYATGTVSSSMAGSNTAATGSNDLDVPAGDDIAEPDVVRGGDVESATSDSTNGISFSYNNENGNLSGNIRIVLVLTIIALAPSILIMLTSYTRIIIVLHFLRTAIGTQTSKSGVDRSGFVFDILHYESGIYPDQ